MTTTAIRIGAGHAYPLLSGGWMCTRPGDAFPVWRHDEQDATRLLRSWLPPIDVPPAGDPLTHPGEQIATTGGRDLDRLDGIAPRVSDSRASGFVAIPPGGDPDATSDSRATAVVGAARVNTNGAAA